MTEIIVIAAIAQNRAIGKDGNIPWRIKEDFQHFKEVTMSHPCIMGRKTFESLPDNFRPLPGRENIVLTLNKDYKLEGTTVFHDFNKAIQYCKDKGEEKVFITGGAIIYKMGLEVADTFKITRIHKDYNADVFFPEVNFDEWELVKRDDREGRDVNTGENVKFSFLTYKRKKN